MKKALISTSVVVAFALYCLHAHNEQNDAAKVTPASHSATPASTTTTSTSSQTATASTSQSSGQYKDGTYTGTSADAYYGYIQVKAVISGGKLTDVIFLDHPNDRRESIEINSQAMPLLKQEAIQAQTAQIDGVSGATDTTQAFIESLNSALNQAKS